MTINQNQCLIDSRDRVIYETDGDALTITGVLLIPTTPRSHFANTLCWSIPAATSSSLHYTFAAQSQVAKMPSTYDCHFAVNHLSIKGLTLKTQS